MRFPRCLELVVFVSSCRALSDHRAKGSRGAVRVRIVVSRVYKLGLQVLILAYKYNIMVRHVQGKQARAVSWLLIVRSRKKVYWTSE